VIYLKICYNTLHTSDIPHQNLFERCSTSV
jgi:hypothetical protein